MSLTRSELKALFETGDLLSQSSFEEFIDGVFNLADDTMAGVTGPTGATGPAGPDILTTKGDIYTHDDIESIRLESTGLTGQDLIINPAAPAGIEWGYNKMNWTGDWDGRVYNPNDVATQGDWLGTANKQTSDQLAPIAVGAKNSPASIAVFGTVSNSSVIYSGHTYTFTKGGWLTEILAYVPELTANTNYRIVIANITDIENPIVSTINDPVLIENAWKVVSLGKYLVKPGTVLKIFVDALNSGSSTNVTGGWRYMGDVKGGIPGSGEWYRDKDNEIRISKIDLDSVDRTTELSGFIPDTDILFALTTDANNFRRYNVEGLLIDAGTYYIIPTSRTDQGGNNLSGEEGEATTLDADIPVPSATKYSVGATGYWTTNPPTYANVEGFTEFNGIPQVGATNSVFGIDFTFQEGTISNDWDIMAASGITSSSGIPNNTPANIVLVQSVLDFPDAVSDIITLVPNTIYQISGIVDIGINRIIFSENNQIFGTFSDIDKLNTSTTNVALSSLYGMDIKNISINAPVASKLIEASDAGVNTVSITQCDIFADVLGTINNYDIIFLQQNTFSTFTSGFQLSGSNIGVLVNSTFTSNYTGTFIDLTNATFTAVSFTNNASILQSGGTWLEIAPDGANMENGGIGSIVNNKIINGAGGTSIVGYDPLDHDWEASLNDTILTSDRIEPSGWGFYVDDESDTIGVDDVAPTKLTIDGLGSISEVGYLPKSIRGIGNLWDTVNSYIKPISVGDSYDMRVQLELTSTAGNPTRIDCMLDIGGTATPAIIISQQGITLKSGTPQTVIFSFPIFALSTFVTNGGQLFLQTNSGSVVISGRQILLTRTSSGAS